MFNCSLWVTSGLYFLFGPKIDRLWLSRALSTRYRIHYHTNPMLLAIRCTSLPQRSDLTTEKQCGVHRIPSEPCEQKAYLGQKVIRCAANPVPCEQGLNCFWCDLLCESSYQLVLRVLTWKYLFGSSTLHTSLVSSLFRHLFVYWCDLEKVVYGF